MYTLRTRKIKGSISLSYKVGKDTKGIGRKADFIHEDLMMTSQYATHIRTSSLRQHNPHITLQKQVMIPTLQRPLRIHQLEVKRPQHLDIELVQLHEGHRLPGAPPPPVPEHEIRRLLHQGPLLRAGLEPALGPEHLDVGAEDVRVAHHGPEVMPDARPAGEEMAGVYVARGWHLLYGQAGERGVDAQTLDNDGLGSLLAIPRQGCKSKCWAGGLTWRYGSDLASSTVIGCETLLSAMAVSISSRSLLYTRGAVMMYNIVVLMAVAVVSEPATS